MRKENMNGPAHYNYKFRIKVSSNTQAKNEAALAVPEVCVFSFSLDKDGKPVEKIETYPEAE